jgi:hypothetical protein
MGWVENVERLGVDPAGQNVGHRVDPLLQHAK